MESGRFILKRIKMVKSCILQLIMALHLLLFSLTCIAAEGVIHSWKINPPTNLKAGDIVFRKGSGIWTKYFINASSREKRFSHVGIVVSNSFPTITILHADANDFTGVGRVRLEEWQGFFKNASECAVYRYNGDLSYGRSFVERGIEKLGVPFDWNFNMNSTNSLYCTELVRNVINDGLQTNLVGSTKIYGRRIIAIDDIYYKGFKKIFDSNW